MKGIVTGAFIMVVGLVVWLFGGVHLGFTHTETALVKYWSHTLQQEISSNESRLKFGVDFLLSTQLVGFVVLVLGYRLKRAHRNQIENITHEKNHIS
jgi:hypothetical protein